MYGRCTALRLRQSPCREYAYGVPALGNPRSTDRRRVPRQAVANDGKAVAAIEQPAEFRGTSSDVEAANLNACVEFLKDELPRIFETGVRKSLHDDCRFVTCI